MVSNCRVSRSLAALAVASARCEALPISASCSWTGAETAPETASRLASASAATLSGIARHDRFAGMGRRLVRRLAHPHQRLDQLGAGILDQPARGAVRLGDRFGDRAQLRLGRGAAFAQRREQGVERLALAGDAGLALRDPVGGVAGGRFHRLELAGHCLRGGGGALRLDLDPGHCRRHVFAQLMGDGGERGLHRLGPAGENLRLHLAVIDLALEAERALAQRAERLAQPRILFVAAGADMGDLAADLVELAGDPAEQGAARLVLAGEPAGKHLDLLAGHVEPLGEALGGLGAGLLERGPALLDHREHRLALRLEPGRA